jgi:hypothetical protein
MLHFVPNVACEQHIYIGLSSNIGFEKIKIYIGD